MSYHSLLRDANERGLSRFTYENVNGQRVTYHRVGSTGTFQPKNALTGGARTRSGFGTSERRSRRLQQQKAKTAKQTKRKTTAKAPKKTKKPEGVNSRNAVRFSNKTLSEIENTKLAREILATKLRVEKSGAAKNIPKNASNKVVNQKKREILQGKQGQAAQKDLKKKQKQTAISIKKKAQDIVAKKKAKEQMQRVLTAKRAAKHIKKRAKDLVAKKRTKTTTKTKTKKARKYSPKPRCEKGKGGRCRQTSTGQSSFCEKPKQYKKGGRITCRTKKVCAMTVKTRGKGQRYGTCSVKGASSKYKQSSQCNSPKKYNGQQKVTCRLTPEARKRRKQLSARKSYVKRQYSKNPNYKPRKRRASPSRKETLEAFKQYRKKHKLSPRKKRSLKAAAKALAGMKGSSKNKAVAAEMLLSLTKSPAKQQRSRSPSPRSILKQIFSH